ncbi:polysaccharide lyase family 7 protein [Olleya sp. HaHaR_3_96]|uniref:polysaccharide lyase family 7 protein n=1 Tax=Olleya sp. HaHaR_3_96 TaxID=2745560 RepID=UPI001C4F22EF|nr:polysaccharide lyase family 7 protein [Olleya sp. HaHaR_3_96]QXP58653.1 polysaccharide lyase family 7 protein [Olleya sp. HaHaR_3_96]
MKPFLKKTKQIILPLLLLMFIINSCSTDEITPVEEPTGKTENTGSMLRTTVSASSSVVIQAENYDSMSGVQTENTQDSGGGQNVGWIDTDDYLEYDLNVSTAGSYKIEFRVASRTNTSKFNFFQDGTKLSNVNKASTGGWQNWVTTAKTVTLSSGNSTLKLLATGSGWNINWIKITPVDVDSGGGGGTGSLDPNKAPSENFDLSTWKITLSSGSEKSVSQLNNGYELSNQFYTGSDGGMVFKNYPLGSGTTTNSTYSRVEFREMLRGTNTSISTSGINGNNWVFSSSSSTNENNAGGVDGILEGTLKVNRVTTTSGSTSQVGRIIIGQIHASGDEPLRLYYHKQPGHSKGAIYFAHEPSGGDEVFKNMIGNYVTETGDEAGDYTGAGSPSNGIALNETFSYKVQVSGNTLSVTLYNSGGSSIASTTYNMSNSNFANDWMYFKAGLYSGNKTVSSSSDYEQVTFYSLSKSHN